MQRLLRIGPGLKGVHRLVKGVQFKPNVYECVFIFIYDIYTPTYKHTERSTEKDTHTKNKEREREREREQEFELRKNMNKADELPRGRKGGSSPNLKAPEPSIEAINN